MLSNTKLPDLSKLKDFDGGIASLWFFTSSHAHLVIRIDKVESETSIFILIYECYRLEALSSWRFHVPQIRLTEENMIELSDSTARFYLLCADLSLQETYTII